jgi:hypothetical protein
VKRFLEMVQLLLALASTTAVIDTTRSLAAPAEPAGYHATEGERGEPRGDRRFGDLARLDRKSREERQRSLARLRSTNSLELVTRVD